VEAGTTLLADFDGGIVGWSETIPSCPSFT
jgi:hypothetical protein